MFEFPPDLAGLYQEHVICFFLFSLKEEFYLDLMPSIFIIRIPVCV